jgi:hypothetical protein
MSSIERASLWFQSTKLGCAFLYTDRKIMSPWPILSCTIVATKSHKIKGYTKKEEKMEKM